MIDQINLLGEVFFTSLHKGLKVLPNLDLYSIGKEKHLRLRKGEKIDTKNFFISRGYQSDNLISILTIIYISFKLML